jgi:hypothetical protein
MSDIKVVVSRIENPSKSPFTPWKTAGYSTNACIVHLPRGRLSSPPFGFAADFR